MKQSFLVLLNLFQKGFEAKLKIMTEIKIKIGLGYWSTYDNKALPNPETFIGEDWDQAERSACIEHIKSGRMTAEYAGFSGCRICKELLGTKDLTDGLFVFPEKFEHYIEAHDLKPPKVFVDYVMNRLDIQAFEKELERITKMLELQEFSSYIWPSFDLRWWKYQELELLRKKNLQL